MFRFGTLLVTSGAVLASLPIVGFIFAPFVKKAARRWVDVGDVADFPAGQTRIAQYTNPISAPWDGQTDRIPCWVRHRDDGTFQVFAINCTHLGCPVKWFQESGLFMCPCHGGAYYEDGSRASGPPPRGLYEYRYKVVDGRLQVDAGRLPTIQESA